MRRNKTLQAITQFPISRAGALTQVLTDRRNKRNHWLPFPLRLGLLIVGSAVLGFGASLTFLADIGLGPVDLFADALSEQTGLPIAIIFCSVACLMILLARLLGAKPGPGTFTAPMIIGVMLQTFGELWEQLPTPSTAVGFIIVLIALPCIGLGGGATITSGLGSGFPDLLATAVSGKTRQSVALIRTFFEVFVLSAGILLGGSFGLGTIMVALLIGMVIRYGNLTTDQLAASIIRTPWRYRMLFFTNIPPALVRVSRLRAKR